MQQIDLALARSLFKPRAWDAYKNLCGHGFLVAGGPGKMGAAIMSAQAALRGGLGLLTILAEAEQQNLLHAATPASMCMGWAQALEHWSSFTAIGVGPGVGTDHGAWQRLHRLIDTRKPMVIDADALTLLGRHQSMHVLQGHHLLTPHIGEFDVLFRLHDTLENRLETAREFSKQQGTTIVLKGAPTHVISVGEVWSNTTGHQGLAKGGSGDVLTGLLLALLAQGYAPKEAALLGVWLHGRAAELSDESFESLLPTDLIACFGKAFRELY